MANLRRLNFELLEHAAELFGALNLSDKQEARENRASRDI